MRFATIGTDSELMAIVSILVQAGHVWRAAVADGPLTAPHEPDSVVTHWEDLFDFPGLELIVLDARSDAGRDDALRKLVQAGARMLLLHPACEAIVAIELEMIRDDVGTVMAAYCPPCQHPAFQALSALAHDPQSEIGTLQQVVMERRLRDRSDGNVVFNLRRDAELVRSLVGRLRHVNAMGEAGKGIGFANLSVNMTSTQDVVVRWSATPGEQDATITLVGAAGQARLDMSESEFRLRHGEVDRRYEASDGQQSALNELVTAKSPLPDWTDIRHGLEVAEAAERSAVKGKTIELFEETYSEEASFKGLMAMGGCGLLLLTLLFMIGWSIVEGVRLPYKRNEYERTRAMERVDLDAAPVEQPQMHLLIRLWPVYPFAIFLLLQLLRLVFRSRHDASATERAPPESSPD